MDALDDYWDAEDIDEHDDLEELVLESYLGDLIFEPPAASHGASQQPREGSEVSYSSLHAGMLTLETP